MATQPRFLALALSLVGIDCAIAEVASPATPGKTFKDCDECPEMVVVPAGEFKMGSPRDPSIFYAEDELPQHDVRIPHDIAAGKFEVTKDQFQRFIDDSRYEIGAECFSFDHLKKEFSMSASYLNPGFGQSGNEPVTCVNWQDASAYARWLSEKTGKRYRLLSEAEWEYAAQSGAQWLLNEDEYCKNANNGDVTAAKTWNSDPSVPAKCSDGFAYTAPVGTFAPNAFGLHDMVGNVREWVEDCWHENYDGAPMNGSAWTSGGDCTQRVMRGGTFDTFGQWRIVDRDPMQAELRGYNNGFRLARDIDPVP